MINLAEKPEYAEKFAGMRAVLPEETD